MKIDIHELKELENLEYVRIVQDGDEDRYIVNYTWRAQIDRAWATYPLLAHCRGLVYRADGTVLAGCMKKFFNLGEPPGPPPENLVAWGVPEVTDKCDGSYIGLYKDAYGIVRLFSRGSFNSEQAEMARIIWAEKNISPEQISEYLTYCFEVIYPENAIVVNYGEKKDLVLLSVILTQTGREYEYYIVGLVAQDIGVEHVASYPFTSLESLAAINETNREGFVLFWPKMQTRVKIKMEEYKLLHRLISHLSEHSIWEALSQGAPVASFSTTQGDVKEWIAALAERLNREYATNLDLVLRYFNAINDNKIDTGSRDGMKIAAALCRDMLPPPLQCAGFNIAKGRNYTGALWKALEPKGKGGRPQRTLRMIGHEELGVA